MSRAFSDKVPLTFQISQLLRNEIAQGILIPGARLSSEVQLAKEFGVSVITIQRALKDMEADGLITRHRGRGTFVASQATQLGLPGNEEVLSAMFMNEFKPDAEVLSWELIDRPAQIKEFDPSVDKVRHLRRRVTRHGKPWSYGSIYVLPDAAKGLKIADLKRYPLFRLMREKLHIELKDVDISFFAQVPPVEVYTQLDIDPIAPTMGFRGVLRDSNNRVINVLHIHFRGDMFAVNLKFDLNNPLFSR